MIHTYKTKRTTPLDTFFFFNDTATTEIYTLSLHDALPILWRHLSEELGIATPDVASLRTLYGREKTLFDQDRKSTRLNSSHSQISYAVFCLKKKNNFYGHRAGPLNSCTFPEPLNIPARISR